MKEIWKDVVNYEGLYKVSNFGNIKSLDRKVLIKRGNQKPFHKTLKGVIIKPYKEKTGYYSVGLHKNGKSKTENVHKIVADAFLGVNKYRSIVIDHVDENKLNNKVSNLQLVPNRYNVNKGVKKSSSRYPGVCWHKQNRKWRSRAWINKERVHLGDFETELGAYKAYQKAVQHEFAIK